MKVTQSLVRIPSENPTGSERECALYVEHYLKDLSGITVQVQPVEDQRWNVIATCKGSDASLRPLVILAHMDTVPVEGTWSQQPFGAEIREGRLYGRGACDMKSGLASALVAFKNVVEQSQPKRDLYLAITVDEEGPFMKGAVALVEEKLIPENAELLVTEPTSNTIAVAHKGTIWYEIIITGKSAHGGHAVVGIDAGHVAAESIIQLKANVADLPYDHQRFGKPTLSVGTIHGGEKTNMVAGSVRMELDFRLVAPMTQEEADELVDRSLQTACRKFEGASYRVNHYGYPRPPIDSNLESDLLKRLESTYETTLKEAAIHTGFPAYTDASMIALKTGKRDLFVFGPANLEQAHRINEYVEVQQIEDCVNVLEEFMKT
ncbi:M20 family metallopeptidase [Geomicrobium sp. JCM 19055]|uniref:M20 family metallopeptidase n=1 Tax=Geomicrobium sp. JCM 19055 TaxID=1460649 RepID=UPI00045ED691|nr:M20 family metallopeptidase [Geomicrobium sp. JCM 19055]GAJ98573.1 acetylornithine deacetylase [Geomicrobium sp. JCM 19055]